MINIILETINKSEKITEEHKRTLRKTLTKFPERLELNFDVNKQIMILKVYDKARIIQEEIEI